MYEKFVRELTERELKSVKRSKNLKILHEKIVAGNNILDLIIF